MTKRRLDDDDLVNLLRQKHKEDPQQKQQAVIKYNRQLQRAINALLHSHTVNVITANTIYAKTAFNNAIYVNIHTVPPVQILSKHRPNGAMEDYTPINALLYTATLNPQIKFFACRVHKANNDATEQFL
ncbi:hypothetical protein MAM1_0330c09743 [Mucor ambiguus]|uniref:Uncharacterized protein n=1 Tax=Mucor ambiguus TaxID=91626 RepID=A0A0C9LXL9_9FUNG|nr:hypothetical protein MAM1_0330c09743 [Mucor ambiguus]